jgi:hypothetical protein
MTTCSTLKGLEIEPFQCMRTPSWMTQKTQDHDSGAIVVWCFKPALTVPAETAFFSKMLKGLALHQIDQVDQTVGCGWILLGAAAITTAWPKAYDLNMCYALPQNRGLVMAAPSLQQMLEHRAEKSKFWQRWKAFMKQLQAISNT